MSGASASTTPAALLGPGLWTQQGPATLVVREAGWVVLVPGTRKEVIEAAWTLLDRGPAPERFLEALVEEARLDGADQLSAVLFGLVEGTTVSLGVKGRTPVAVHTADAAQLVAGTEKDPFVLRTVEGVRRLAFGDLPAEEPVGTLRVATGIVRVRGFVQATVDPTSLPEQDRAALAAQVDSLGRSIEDPEKAERAAAPPTAKPAATSPRPARTPIRRPATAGRRPGEMPPSAGGVGASSRTPQAVPEPAGPNMFDGLFAPEPADPAPAPSPAPAPQGAQPAPTAQEAPAAPASAGPAPSTPTAAPATTPEPASTPVATPEPAPTSSPATASPPASAAARRRLVSTSLFDRRPRGPGPSLQRSEASVPAETTSIPDPPQQDPPAPDTLVAPIDDGEGPEHAESMSPDTLIEPAESADPALAGSPATAPAPGPRPAQHGSTPAPASEGGEAGAYDDLFGTTVSRRIEDAAVRRGAEDDAGGSAIAGGLGGTDHQDHDPDAGSRRAPGASSGRPLPPTSAPAEQSTTPGASTVAPPSGAPAGDGDFIDWVPGVGRAAPEIAHTAARRAVTPPRPEPVYPQVQMAQRPPQPAEPPRSALSAPAHRHAGPTASGSSHRAVAPRASSPAPAVSVPGQPTGGAVALSGLVCVNGHANSAERSRCRLCGAPLDGTPRTVARPPLGAIEMSTGERFVLDRTAIVGRRPRASRVSGHDVPQLITVPSPQQDVSRSHLELRLEGWHVVALDLGTTNGTTLHREGADPLRLRPREGIVLHDGDHLDLGDGVHLWMRERP